MFQQKISKLQKPLRTHESAKILADFHYKQGCIRDKLTGKPQLQNNHHLIPIRTQKDTPIPLIAKNNKPT
ncbi:MAG: hypothetical protein LBI56_03115 [Puniceicoccales bacterium]|jgi:hypothetical protein|nr:hypothetical protein [Puniceicoccales bacterium]